MASAIADYLVLAADKPSADAIRHRLNHVIAYLGDQDLAATRCDQVDPAWIERFRKWLAAKPIVSPTGKSRPRALSTVENSVTQLSAAINECGGTTAKFTALQPKEVNRTPHYRASVSELAAMFRFCLYPEGRSDKEIDRRRRERANLLAFLRISVATLARPDAAHDVSTDPTRRQWNSNARVLSLNPDGRRQTKKYRATVPIARRMAAILDETKGTLIPNESVRSAWRSMAAELKLPDQGESGMKLIRRSVAHILRERLPSEAWTEIEIFLGHSRFASVSDLYAPLQPDYLRRALAAIEGLIEDIESEAPGAFYRELTAEPGKVLRLGSAKK